MVEKEVKNPQEEVAGKDTKTEKTETKTTEAKKESASEKEVVKEPKAKASKADEKEKVEQPKTAAEKKPATAKATMTEEESNSKSSAEKTKPSAKKEEEEKTEAPESSATKEEAKEAEPKTEATTEKVTEEKAVEDKKETAKTTADKKKTEKSISRVEDFNWEEFLSEDDSYSGKKREDYEKMYDDTLSTVAENEVVDGTVISMNNREVVINIGYKSEGVVSFNEFRYNPELKAGDIVEVYVESKEDKRGNWYFRTRWPALCGHGIVSMPLWIKMRSSRDTSNAAPRAV